MKPVPLPTPAESPYSASQAADHRDIAWRDRVNDIWRRVAIVGWSCVGLELLLCVVLASRFTPHFVVLGTDSSGRPVAQGTVEVTAPSQAWIEASLRSWYRDVRDVPGRNQPLIERNRLDAYGMTQAGSAAKSALDLIYAPDSRSNPNALGENLTRTVEYVAVSHIEGTLSYNVTALEAILQGGVRKPSVPVVGTIEIVEPVIPTDQDLLKKNPAGVYVKSFDVNWSDPR